LNKVENITWTPYIPSALNQRKLDSGVERNHVLGWVQIAHGEGAI